MPDPTSDPSSSAPTFGTPVLPLFDRSVSVLGPVVARYVLVAAGIVFGFYKFAELQNAKIDELRVAQVKAIKELLDTTNNSFGQVLLQTKSGQDVAQAMSTVMKSEISNLETVSATQKTFLKDSQNYLDQKIAQVNTDLKLMQARTEDLQKAAAKAQDEALAAKRDAEKLDTESKALSKAVEAKRQDLAKVQAALQDAQLHSSASSGVVAALNNVIFTLQQQLATLQQQTETMRQEVVTASEQLLVLAQANPGKPTPEVEEMARKNIAKYKG